MGSAHGYRYVGPAGLAERARPGPDVITVTSAQALTRWLSGRPADELGEPFTFVVGLDGQLRLAPRRSEHVDCAAGQPVLAAAPEYQPCLNPAGHCRCRAHPRLLRQLARIAS